MRASRVVVLGLVAGTLASACRSEGLPRLRRQIAAGELGNIHSVMVVQDGKAVAEWYFSGTDETRGVPAGTVTFDATRLHDLRSMSKSVVSLLFGIALAQGKIGGLDQPVLGHFPEYADLRTADRMKIRVRDILSMTSGLAWNESLPYTDPRNSEIAMDLAADRYRYVLSQAIVSAPGDKFRYSGGDVALAAAILARATGMPLDVYAERVLWRPLGIRGAVWLKDDKGVPYAASGLRLTTPDIAKLGRLVLDQGRWNGQQVVPAAWIGEATSPHAQVEPDDPRCGMRYGYYWWLGQGCQTTPPTPWFAAFGNGGQRLFVVPERRLVVVCTSGAYNQPDQNRGPRAILAAVMAATAR